jgi:asparagine synthase (glutamine-hydrolysing)
MCGIAGRINYASRAPVDPTQVEAMLGLLAHRGPDGQGVYWDRFVALGHRRLAIVDLSPLGSQPMSSDDGSATVTFNGEIYNYLELREELLAKGHRFRSNSDTEVILAAYLQWGLSCFERLAGMFSIVLWDARRNRVVMVRDRLGKKPLFYRFDRAGVAFASEPKAFFADPQFSASADPQSISDYLAFQYVPSPRSIFQGVHKLPPAHFMVIEDGMQRIDRYWRLSYARQPEIDEEEAVGLVDDHLRKAVRRRMISDVPLGAFLSGGIDSSLVVSYMAELSSSVNTFSIGFSEQEYNELPAARLVAERYGTKHVEFVVEPHAVDLLPKLAWHYDEPFADSSALPTYILSELTRRHVTVALNGDGGDESFVGYDRYFAAQLAERFGRIPRSLRQLAGYGGRLLAAARSTRTTRRIRRFLTTGAVDPQRQYGRWMMHIDPDLRKDLLTQAFSAEVVDDSDAAIDRLFVASDAPTFVERCVDSDIRSYLPGDLLVKVDVASMAHGLEGRSPFLDHELMECAAGFPLHMKLRGRTKKHLLRRLAETRLPSALLALPKMGFGVPIDHWFRGSLGAFARDTLLSGRAQSRDLFNSRTVERLFTEHDAGLRQWHHQLWNLLMLELWFQTFIDVRPAPAPPGNVAQIVGGADAARA